MQLNNFIIRFLFIISFLILMDIFTLNIFFKNELQSFILDIYLVLLIFTFASFLVAIISYFFYQKNFDIVGYIFLFVTTIKMAGIFLLGNPLFSKSIVLEFEKIHFFILFFLFLLVETYMTITLLNKPTNPRLDN